MLFILCKLESNIYINKNVIVSKKFFFINKKDIIK